MQQLAQNIGGDRPGCRLLTADYTHGTENRSRTCQPVNLLQSHAQSQSGSAAYLATHLQQSRTAGSVGLTSQQPRSDADAQANASDFVCLPGLAERSC